jgi:hypothetical protein
MSGNVLYNLCCGSGSSKIGIILPDPDPDRHPGLPIWIRVRFFYIKISIIFENFYFTMVVLWDTSLLFFYIQYIHNSVSFEKLK